MDLPAVPALDDARPAARRSPGTPSSAVPAGALGRLAELGVWLAAAQGSCPPRPPARPRVVVVAGDHGIAAAGVSAHPPASTRAPGRRAPRAHRAGRRAGPVAGPRCGSSTSRCDAAAGRPASTLPGAVRQRPDRPRGRADRGRRPSAPSTVGRALADEEVDAGADLLVPGFARGRRHDARLGARRRDDRHRAGGGHRPRQRHRRRRLDAQGRRGARRAAPRQAGRPRPARAAARRGRRRPRRADRVLPAGRGAAHAGAARRRSSPPPRRCSPTSWPRGARRGGCSPSAPPSPPMAHRRRAPGARPRCSTWASGSATAPARRPPSRCCRWRPGCWPRPPRLGASSGVTGCATLRGLFLALSWPPSLPGPGRRGGRRRAAAAGGAALGSASSVRCSGRRRAAVAGRARRARGAARRRPARRRLPGAGDPRHAPRRAGRHRRRPGLLRPARAGARGDARRRRGPVRGGDAARRARACRPRPSAALAAPGPSAVAGGRRWRRRRAGRRSPGARRRGVPAARPGGLGATVAGLAAGVGRPAVVAGAGRGRGASCSGPARARSPSSSAAALVAGLSAHTAPPVRRGDRRRARRRERAGHRRGLVVLATAL